MMRVLVALTLIVVVIILPVLIATGQHWIQEARPASSRRVDDETQARAGAQGAWREMPPRESAATVKIDPMEWEWIDLTLLSSDYNPPVQLDVAPIRSRILALIDQPPAFAPDDTTLFAIPRWCIAQFAAAERVTFEEAANIAIRSLTNSATHDGRAFLAAIEQATPTSELDRRARRICATELYYALPDG